MSFFILAKIACIVFQMPCIEAAVERVFSHIGKVEIYPNPGLIGKNYTPSNIFLGQKIKKNCFSWDCRSFSISEIVETFRVKLRLFDCHIFISCLLFFFGTCLRISELLNEDLGFWMRILYLCQSEMQNNW